MQSLTRNMPERYVVAHFLCKIYGLLTKRKVKIAADIAQVLFIRFYHAQKERGQYHAFLTEQVWSIKDFLDLY